MYEKEKAFRFVQVLKLQRFSFVRKWHCQCPCPRSQIPNDCFFNGREKADENGSRRTEIDEVGKKRRENREEEEE